MSLLSPQLDAFVTIAQLKTVHGAAKKLGITQTGVTQRIRALEAQLGTTLFTRSRKGMLLTNEGGALLRYCQAALDLEGEALAQIQGAGAQATVRVAIIGPSSILRARVIPQCLSALEKFPEILITFNLADTEIGDGALRSGQAQLAVLPRGQVAREMDSKLIRPERYILVGPRKWRRRPIRDIISTERIIDFDPSDPMTVAYLKKYDLFELTKLERHFVNSSDALARLVQAGMGYSVLSEDFARPLIKSGDLAEIHPGCFYEFSVALAWYPRPKMPAYFSALINSIH